MRSEAGSVEAYLASLPEDRRDALSALVDVVRANLPAGYEEAVGFGMPCWQVPLAFYPDTYNKQPLLYAAVAAQKNHLALYLMNVYAFEDVRARLEAGWQAAGKKLDMGKSCIRFKRLADVPLDVVAEVIAATPRDAFVTHAKSLRKKS